MPSVQAPFRVKGTIYRATRDFFETQGPGAYDRLLVAITDPALRAFFTQPFLAASWYDVLPVASLIEIEAKALGLSLTEYLRQRTLFQADRDIGGVYRFLLKLTSPEAVAPRLGGLLSQVFDFGTPSIEHREPRKFRYRFAGWPLVLVPWYSTAFTIYARRALALAGAKDVQIELEPVVVEAVREGVEIGTIKAELRF